MAIATYNDLAATVKAYCARSDSTFSAQIETFVALHELRMYNGSGEEGDPLACDSLSAPEIEATVTVTVAAGVVAMPADASTLRTVTRAGDEVGLDYVTPRTFAIHEARNTGDASRPSYYTVQSRQILVASGYAGPLTLVYYQVQPAVSTSNQSNVLLVNYPLLYLNGVMFEAFSFMQAADLAMAWFTRYKSALAGVNQSARGVRYGGVPLRVRVQDHIP